MTPNHYISEAEMAQIDAAGYIASPAQVQALIREVRGRAGADTTQTVQGPRLIQEGLLVVAETLTEIAVTQLKKAGYTYNDIWDLWFEPGGLMFESLTAAVAHRAATLARSTQR